MPCAAPTAAVHAYRPRTAEHTVLYGIVQTHLATFLRTTAAADARGLPAFVERERRTFLTCGVWHHGFARFRCDARHAVGSAVNLSVHFHTLVLDGVFAPHPSGALRFAPAPSPSDRDVARLLATIVARVDRLLRRCRLAAAADTPAVDPVSEDAPLLAALVPRPRINLVRYHHRGVYPGTN